MRTGGRRSARARFGGYEDHFAGALDLCRHELLVCRANEGEPLPDAAGLRGVLLSGAGASVYEALPWMDALGRWALGLLADGPPLLAVCFSHQLMGALCGGVVGAAPAGPEFGTAEIRLTAAAAADPLFGVMPCVMTVQQAHYEGVLTVPAAIPVLASSAMDPNQVLRLGPRAWSVQFHPERDAALCRAVVERNRGGLSRLGADVDGCLDDVRPSADGALLLRQFRDLCGRDAPG